MDRGLPRPTHCTTAVSCKEQSGFGARLAWLAFDTGLLPNEALALPGDAGMRRPSRGCAPSPRHTHRSDP
ncbi:MAG TPA: hypothetical protein VFX60_13200, partial [Micromonospora sp.]|nr:hypothetical protein [Micromonospora sp.]